MYTNLPTSQGYIFRILQHFATKLCSFSNFDNLFPEISFVIPRLKMFLRRKSSIENNFPGMMVQFGRPAPKSTLEFLTMGVQAPTPPPPPPFTCPISRVCIFNNYPLSFEGRQMNKRGRPDESAAKYVT